MLRFADLVCSEIVLGNNMAVGLPARKAVYCVDGEYSILYTTNLKDRIRPFIEPSEVKFMPEQKTYQKPEGKVPEISFENVDKEKTLEENIKKISGYVPYVPKGGKIKDAD
jgi:hypothetical protein